MFADLLNKCAEAAMGLEQLACGSLGAAEVTIDIFRGLRLKLESDEPSGHLCREETMPAGFEEGGEFEFGGLVRRLRLCRGGHGWLPLSVAGVCECGLRATHSHNVEFETTRARSSPPASTVSVT